MTQLKDTEESVGRKINSLTQYGVRQERATQNGYIIVWSNAQASWYRHYYVTKKGEVKSLDANMLLVYMTHKVLDECLPRLPVLPLYSNSFEYRVIKGEIKL
jgi:hypothetical protein